MKNVKQVIFKNLSKGSLYLFVVLLLSVMLACSSDDDDEISGESPASILNSSFTIERSGVFTVNPDDVDIDNSINVEGGNGIMPLEAGASMESQISFQNDGNSSVQAVGMRFGDSGPITFVPLTQQELDNGIANLPLSIDPSVCNNIQEICHDIKCYEFAQTSSGQISQADLQDIALVCGACDEPSCTDLLPGGFCSGQGADGSPRFNLTWSGSSDLDLNVTDPSGETINFINSNSSSGGILDVDCLGNCPNGNSENITWPNGGSSGTYSFYVNYFSGSGSVDFEILVRDNTQNIRTETGTVSQSGDDSNTFTYIKND